MIIRAFSRENMIFNPKNTGSILLYDGVTGHARLGQNPIREMDHFDFSSGHYMGYLAYPNPTLQNDIPAMRFFEYEKIEEVENFDIGEKARMIIRAFSTSGELEQSVSKAEYLQKIAEIKELLAAGEIYQLNYAIRFRKAFSGDPFALYQKLCEVNPAAFSAFVNAGDFQIISLSPERLFKVKEGVITTQPIKGLLRSPITN
ncbi:chorismate-binding protein [Candidatus Peregrinibacteria bacterium]|nr:MAG: chorismate-binding protein [Candidatus Peregrinibacteria bacterium]